MGETFKTRHFEKFGAIALIHFFGKFAEVPKKLYVFSRSETFVEIDAKALRHVAHMRFDRFRIGRHIDAVNFRRSFVDFKNAGKHLNDAGLSRAIRTDQTKDLATTGLE